MLTNAMSKYLIAALVPAALISRAHMIREIISMNQRITAASTKMIATYPRTLNNMIREMISMNQRINAASTKMIATYVLKEKEAQWIID